MQVIPPGNLVQELGITCSSLQQSCLLCTLQLLSWLQAGQGHPMECSQPGWQLCNAKAAWAAARVQSRDLPRDVILPWPRCLRIREQKGSQLSHFRENKGFCGAPHPLVEAGARHIEMLPNPTALLTAHVQGVTAPGSLQLAALCCLQHSNTCLPCSGTKALNKQKVNFEKWILFMFTIQLGTTTFYNL